MCMQLRIACIGDRCGILSVLKHRIMGFGVGDCEYRPLQYLESRNLGEHCLGRENTYGPSYCGTSGYDTI